MATNVVVDLEAGHVNVLNGNDDNGPKIREKVEEVAQTVKDLQFFYTEGRLADRVKSFVGVAFNEAFVAVVNVKEQQNYIYKGENTAPAIAEWMKSVQKGKEAPYRKSGQRPPNDRDPEHPLMYQLTADSFSELVLEGDKEVLVDLWADWCGPCLAVAPTLETLTEVLFDVPSIAVAKMNVDENATDRAFFPEPHIPNMKFFSLKDKKNPIKYDGDRSLSDFVEFIHKHAQTPFDLAVYKERAQRLEKLSGVRTEAKRLLDKSRTQVDKHAAVLPAEEKTEIDDLIANLSMELAKGAESVKDKIEEYAEALVKAKAWGKLKEAERKWKEEEEEKSLKRVIKVVSDEEYDAVLDKASKDGLAMIVDCFATWCGPCVYIAPAFNDLSEKYPSLVFVKIDVDKQQKTAQKLNINAMPTFKVIKEGHVVDELVGADPDGLEKLCKKYGS